LLGTSIIDTFRQENMKGIKTGGRTKGKENKNTADIKQAYQSLLENNLSNIEIWLSTVAKDNPSKALDFMLRLSEFIVPKQKAIEFKEPATPEKRNVIIWGGRSIEI